MSKPLLFIGDRDYKSVRSFCLELAKKDANEVKRWGSATLSFSIPYNMPPLDLVDVVELEIWFEAHKLGVDYSSLDTSLEYYALEDARKLIRTTWRKTADKELNAMIGRYFK